MIHILDCINEAERIALLTHVPPDGDALGSSLAMQRFLTDLGKRAAHLYCCDVPEAYTFMPGLDVLTRKQDGCIYDLCITLDCATPRMLGPYRPVFDRAKATAVIDHHLSNDGYGDYNLVDPQASSTSEMVLRVLEAVGYAPDAVTASCLYTGISSDTGNFCYSNTSPAALVAAAKLVQAGADVVQIASRLYRCRSAAKTLLIGRALGSLQLHAGGKVAIMVLRSGDFQEIGARERDCEGIIEYAREVDGVEAAALVRELENGKFKISLRSKFYADVRQVAESLGGGGHERASGCRYAGELDALLGLLAQRLEDTLA